MRLLKWELFLKRLPRIFCSIDKNRSILLLLHCMTILRNTQVVSVSLPKRVARKLERARKASGQSRSAFIASLIDKEAEEIRWQKIYKRGRETARKFKITSEEDIDRILHAS